MPGLRVGLLQLGGIPEHRTLNEIHVHVTVAVVVEERHSRAHHLGEVQVAGHTVEVNEVESQICGPVDEEILGSSRSDQRQSATQHQKEHTMKP